MLHLSFRGVAPRKRPADCQFFASLLSDPTGNGITLALAALDTFHPLLLFRLVCNLSVKPAMKVMHLFRQGDGVLWVVVHQKISPLACLVIQVILRAMILLQCISTATKVATAYLHPRSRLFANIYLL